MPRTDPISTPSLPARLWPALALLLATGLLAWVYAPGIYGPAVFDDFVVLSPLDGAGASWAGAWDAVRRDDSGLFGRPVAIATFILEDRLFGTTLQVSKAVNIAIHCLNLLLLVWWFARLLRAAGAPSLWIAIFAGCAWAFAPLLVSTTLYTVQRMAMLSCTFALLTLLAYDYWRSAGPLPRYRHALCAAAVSGSAVLAVLAKENALVLPLLLLLLEMAWYRFADARGRFSLVRLRLWLVAGLLLGLAGLLFLLLGWSRFTAGYAMRDFGLGGRLVAEGAILWDYLRQLLWPDVLRLGLYHDDAARIFSTQGSLRGWLLVIAWPLLLALPMLLFRYPLLARLSACLALFFCAHLTESTVIPLELYFEHRNYLPGVFVALAGGLLLAELRHRLPAILPPLAALLSLLLLVQLSQTSLQVQLWSSESLWRMAQLRGHPESFRANYDMAVELASRGALPGALAFSRQAHALTDESELDLAMRNVLLDCLAEGDGNTVAALPDEPGSDLSALHTLRMVVSLVEQNSCPQLPAEELAVRLARIFPAAGEPEAAYPLTYFLLALLENSRGETRPALSYVQRYVARVPDNPEALLMQLHLATASGESAAAAAARERLAALQARAALSARQRATLALYPE